MTTKEEKALTLMEQNGEFDDEIPTNKQHRIEKARVWLDRPQQAPEWFLKLFDKYLKAVKD